MQYAFFVGQGENLFSVSVGSSECICHSFLWHLWCMIDVDGKIKVGDQLLSVEGMTLHGLSTVAVLNILRNLPDQVSGNCDQKIGNCAREIKSDRFVL